MSKNIFTCNKCNKEFKYKSKLDEHHNRKGPCVKKNESYDCELCKSTFQYKSHLDIHKQSKKHIDNYNVHIENYIHIENHYNEVTIINSFEETNLNVLDEKRDIENLYNNDINLYNMFQDFKNENKQYPYNTYFIYCFNYFIKIFTKLNFNLAYSENHNCNVFAFIEIDFNKITYQIMTFDTIMKKYTWKNKIDYNIFIEKFLDLMIKIDVKFNNPQFAQVLDYVLKYKKKYLLTDEYTKIEIEKNLLNEYNKFEIAKSNLSKTQIRCELAELEHNRKLEIQAEKINQAIKLQGLRSSGVVNNIKN